MAQLGILKLKQYVESLLEFVKADYLLNLDNDNLEESFLYRCIDAEDIADGISYRELASELFTRDTDDFRRAIVELMFSEDKVSLPQIAVREPAKMKGQQDGIGGIGEEAWINLDGTFAEERRKSFISQYELMITSPNRHEVIIMEEVLLALFISSQDTLALIHPFYNFNFTVKELMVNGESYGHQLYIKSITINTSYDKIYPNLINSTVLNSILFTKNLLPE